MATPTDAPAARNEPDAELPDYQPMLAAYHRAFAPVLRSMVAALPLEPGATVLDMACGDGTYLPLLAERVGAGGLVVAADISPAYLDAARRRAAEARSPARFVASEIARLPFDDGALHAAWCAQSLYSLPDPLDSLRHLRRVVRPGGLVAVLENDTLHHVLLPWPVEVELAIRAAELGALAEESDRPRKFYVARRLTRLFRAAGLERVEVRTYATDHLGPPEGDLRTFVAEYLRDLADRVAPRLAPAARLAFDPLVDPASEDYLLDDPDLTLTVIDRVVWGFRPGV